MSKRCLPQRSTRGQTPLFLRDAPPTPKKEKPIAVQDPQETQRRNLQIKRKNQQFFNFKKYPFHRAVHYFFDLNIFPRCQGHISYAIDQHNALQNSFSNDKNQLSNCKYGQVLNRKYFGLPIDEKFIQNNKKQNKTKNICHVYLWQIQDKKYQCDRIITTLSVIAKKLKKGITLLQLRSFSILSKDEDLRNVLNQSLHIDERIYILNERIQILQNKKENNTLTWQADDHTYFYHSLNQKLHNQVLQLKKQLLVQHVVRNLQNSSLKILPMDRKTYCQKMLYYYYDQVQAVETIFLTSQPQPCSLFLFQNAKDTIKLAAQIVAKKSQFVGEVHFYQAKSMLKKLFNFDLTFKSQKNQTLVQYQKNFRKKCQQVKKWKQKNSRISVKPSFPSLSAYVTNKKLVLGQRVQISGKEYLMMLVFYWICKALSQIKPLLNQFPELVNFISSDYFPKVYTSLVEATSSPLIAMMHASIESLPDLFSKSDPFALYPFKLHFQYSAELGVGLLFKQDFMLEGPTQGVFGRQQQKSQVVNKRFRGDNG